MSVAWILDSNYSTIKNSKLNQALEVTTSLKAPVHYVSDLSISKNEAGNMEISAPVVEAVIIQSDSVNTDSIFTSALNPTIDTTDITVNGNLDFSNINNLLNVNSMTVGTGAGVENQVLSLDSNLNLVWKNDASSDVSQWSTYPAVSDVEVGINKVNFNTINLQYDSEELVCSGNLTANYLYSRTDFGAAGSFYNTGNIAQLCRTDATNKDVLKINKLTNLVSTETDANLEGFNNISSESVSTKNIIIPDSTPSTGQVIKYNGSGIEWANDTNTPADWSQYPAQQNVDMNTFSLDNVGAITMSSALNCNQINPLEGFTELSLTADLNMVSHRLDADIGNFTGKVSVASLFPTYIQQNTLYVSSNGSDTNNGSFEAPVKTIQRAIQYAESAYDNTYWYINIGAGVYTENITITKKMFLKGMAPSNSDGCSVGCQIAGDITISMDSNDGDMQNNQVSLSNLLITGEIICNSASTARSVLTITDCYLYNDSGSGSMIHYNPNASDGRVRIYNSKIINQSVSGNQATIHISKGMLKMQLCEISGSSDVNILKLDGTARVDSVVLCSFTSNTASTTAASIVELSGTGNVYTFSQNAFIYTSSANKSASVNSCAILCNSATTQPTVILTYNSFFLGGTSNLTNFVLQDANFGNARTAIILYFSNNANLNNAYQLKGSAGVNKFSLQNVA